MSGSYPAWEMDSMAGYPSYPPVPLSEQCCPTEHSLPLESYEPHPPAHNAHYPPYSPVPPFGHFHPTEYSLPLKSYKPYPPINDAQSFTSSNNAYVSTNNTCPQPCYPPMQGYNYARSDPFQQPQQSHKPVYLPPSYDLTSNGSAHYPHNTSTITTPTWSETADPPAPAPVDGPEDHASSYHLTPATPTTSPYKPSNHTNSSTSAHPPIPPSAKSINPPPPAASANPPSDRSKQYRARLGAVNGVRTASKQPVGKATSPKLPDNPCPICGLGHKRPYHLESHFIGCAESHGNPEGYFWNELLVYKRRVRSARERDQARDGAGHGGGKSAGGEEGDETLRGGGGGGKRARVEEGDETPRGEGGGGGRKRARVARGGLRFGEALSVALGYEDLLSLAERVHRSCFSDA